MSPHPARLAPLQASAWAVLALLTLLALLATGAAAPAAPGSTPALDRAAAADDEATLAVARDRAARADAAVDDLKRALVPGHLTDPLPEADRPFGLETLRAQYDDMDRRAAGYRATLGDQHPTLVAAEQALADLRAQLLGGTRRALATAEREAAEARNAAAAAERRIVARTAAEQSRAADATGSIATAPVRRPRPLAIPTALPAAADTGSAPAETPASVAASRAGTTRLFGAAAAALAVLLFGWAALQIGRALRRPRRAAASRRVEPALAVAPPAAAAPAPSDAVAVLATLPLPGAEATDRIAEAFGREPRGALAVAAAGLLATLCAALEGRAGGRTTMLVTGSGGSPDGAALALALAAAAAGRRVALMEARALGGLRRAMVPAGTVPMLIAAGGTERTLYRIEAGPLAVAVLPSDAGEAEAAAAAAVRPGTHHLRGLDAFDTVILVGEETAALARAADLVLIAAPPGTAPSALAATARPCREAGRLCGAVTVEPTLATAAHRPAMGRRRAAPDPAHLARGRLGLRGSFEPALGRAG